MKLASVRSSLKSKKIEFSVFSESESSLVLSLDLSAVSKKLYATCLSRVKLFMPGGNDLHGAYLVLVLKSGIGPFFKREVNFILAPSKRIVFTYNCLSNVVGRMLADLSGFCQLWRLFDQGMFSIPGDSCSS